MAEVLAVVSTIKEVYGIFETIQGIYDAIQDIKDLPQTFLEIRQKLDLVKRILSAAEKQFNSQKQLSSDEEKEVNEVIQTCLKKATELRDLSNDVAEKKGDGAWASIKKFYKDGIKRRFGKLQQNRVEDLMKDIWESLQALAALAHFNNTAALADIEKELHEAVTALAKVAEQSPSLSNAEMDEGTTFNQENSGTYARGMQNKDIYGNVSMDTVTYSGPSLASGHGATANVGATDFLEKLFAGQKNAG
jgi:predicted translin family RNA/ssDNA-binding protein